MTTKAQWIDYAATLETERAAKDREIARLREALKALIDRLDEINAHSEFKSVWTLHSIHGGRYSGPNWVKPLEDARTALKGNGEGK